MNTKETTREQISALADGELDERQLDAALASLRDQDARADWDLYHQIGDLLRSDDMAVGLSPGFSARMAARLDAEPTIVAPPSAVAPAQVKSAARSSARKWALPSMAAAAAMASVAFIATPQLMVAMKGDSSSTAQAPVQLAGGEQPGIVAASAPEGVVLRDPRIDDYLMAHQRISPSVYSSAQFARSATFATNPGK